MVPRNSLVPRACLVPRNSLAPRVCMVPRNSLAPRACMVPRNKAAKKLWNLEVHITLRNVSTHTHTSGCVLTCLHYGGGILYMCQGGCGLGCDHRGVEGTTITWSLGRCEQQRQQEEHTTQQHHTTPNNAAMRTPKWRGRGGKEEGGGGGGGKISILTMNVCTMNKT